MTTYLFPSQAACFNSAIASIDRPDTCDVERITHTVGSGGGRVESWAVQFASVACGVFQSPMGGGSESVYAGTEQGKKSRRISIDGTLDIKQTDRIHLKTRNGETVSVYYQILDIGDVSDVIDRTLSVVEMPAKV